MKLIVCKPDTLWNFLKNAPDPLTLGRVCFALANREESLDTPLSPLERTFLKMIVESAEWMCDAVQKKHEYYQKAKLKKSVEKLESNNSTDKLESNNSSRKISAFLPSFLPSNNNSSGGGGITRTRAVETPATNTYPTTFKEVREYLASVNLTSPDEDILFAKFLDLNQKGWKDGRKRQIKNWKEFFSRMVQKQIGGLL